MSRTWQLALFVLGATVFGYLVAQIGITELTADAARTGLMFVPIVALYALVYACSALAWQLTMAGDPQRPSYWRTFAVLISSGALNFLTPLINAGGEPYRVAAMAPWLGKRRAAGSVILHRMLHTFTYVLIWLTAVLLAFPLLPRGTPQIVWVLLGVVLVLILGIIVLFLSALRRGMLERILNWMERAPFVNRLAVKVEPHRALLIELDRQITDFYHRSPRRFVQAIALEYLSRCIFMVELVLIVASLGFGIDYLRAFSIGGLEAIVSNALFFVPFEVGAREGAFFLLFKLFGMDPQVGLYTSIVGRVRDFAWIAGGLVLIWVTGGGSREPAPSAAPPVAPRV
ncbi:MAG: hypothetical protein AUH75_10560 [Gemmatimonadetes bacterium 13_1_40CM_4_65_7]|nr:MAG: hypothetical protein AUH75_10560 [Gemmatimonadetes bacterium 13_1_40CM_4_65_7]